MFIPPCSSFLEVFPCKQPITGQCAVVSIKTKLWEAVVVGVQVASHQCSPSLIPSWGSDPGAVREKGFVPV